jgi:cell fate regulator YaaT (PSP1 superfamily)
MPEVVGVRFKQAGPIYHFEPGGIDFEVGDWVVVDTARGQSLGKAVMARREVSPGKIQGPLKSVVRRAEASEISKAAELKDSEKETLIKCGQLVAQYNLPMKVVATEYNFDGSRLMVYFTAESKVDFRALLKEMGSLFKTRVELRQIGARDAAKLLGGIGRCGRALCCTTYLCKFDPISVKMARDQGLSLNPATISGVCGKLLCCLKYEHEQYLAMKSINS